MKKHPITSSSVPSESARATPALSENAKPNRTFRAVLRTDSKGLRTFCGIGDNGDLGKQKEEGIRAAKRRHATTSVAWVCSRSGNPQKGRASGTTPA